MWNNLEQDLTVLGNHPEVVRTRQRLDAHVKDLCKWDEEWLTKYYQILLRRWQDFRGNEEYSRFGSKNAAIQTRHTLVFSDNRVGIRSQLFETDTETDETRTKQEAIFWIQPNGNKVQLVGFSSIQGSYTGESADFTEFNSQDPWQLEARKKSHDLLMRFIPYDLAKIDIEDIKMNERLLKQ